MSLVAAQSSKRRLSFLLQVVAISLLTHSAAFAQADVQGQWTTLPTSMPINPVHVAMLHTGKVLVVSGSGNVPTNLNYQAGLWDPISDTVTTQPLTWDMFCNGMVILPDGKPLIVGGTLQYDPFFGQQNVATYDPATNLFANVQSMTHGRWYPTPTSLGDGRVMAFSGLDVTGSTTSAVEIFTEGQGWTSAGTAPFTPGLYPRMHLLPNGNVFMSGPATTSVIFQPSTQTWTNSASTNYSAWRTYGSSVLLPMTPANGFAPRVMVFGGADPSTNTTEVIDLSQPTPVWQWGPNMSQPRIEMNATILPSGKVLALGGSYHNEDNASASFNADLYDPVANTMSSAGANAFPRLYHSVALLLPDATVWVAGGNPVRGTYQPQMEIYQPAYLFTKNAGGQVVPAVRPVIASAPPAIAYGSTFSINTPDAASISSLALIRAGAPTHAFDQEQRMIGLNFTADAQNQLLSATAPANGYLAPPGYYMLFMVNTAGVPSIASWVQVTDFTVTTTSLSRSVTQGSKVVYPFTVTPQAGFSAQVNFSVAGLPAGATATFAPASVSSGVSKMTITTAAAIIPGKYPLTITAAGNSIQHTVSATLIVQVKGTFSLTVTPSTQTVSKNSTSTYTVTVTPLNGFYSPVNLTVRGNTAHIVGTLNPTSITQSGTSTLTVTVDSQAPTGPRTLTIAAASGSLAKTASIKLTVQ